MRKNENVRNISLFYLISTCACIQYVVGIEIMGKEMKIFLNVILI